MMKNHNTKWRSIIAAVLALCMVFAAVPFAVFAKGTPKLVLVSFGDSMTNGYGLEGYETDDGTNVNGFRQNDVTETYPALLKEYLGGDEKVDWRQLAISCMRPEDINFLLRFDLSDAMRNLIKLLKDASVTAEQWDDPVSTTGIDLSKLNAAQKTMTVKELWADVFKDKNGNVIGDFYTFKEFVNNRFKDYADYKASEKVTWADGTSNTLNWSASSTAAYARYFQKSVEEADYITLGVGDSNFGVIMLRNLFGALGVEFGDFEYRDVAVSAKELLTTRLDEDLLPYVDMVLNPVKAIAAKFIKEYDIPEDMAAKLTNTLCYTTASMFVSYWDMLCAIDELNDKEDLKVIMLDLFNTMDGVTIELPNGMVADLGGIIEDTFDIMSAVLFAMPVIRQDVGNFENITFYAVPNDKPIEMINVDMTKKEKITAETVLRDRMIESTEDVIFKLIKDAIKTNFTALGLEIVDITRADVEAYDKMFEALKKQSYGSVFGATTPDKNKIFTCALYRAIEDQIMDVADDKVIGKEAVSAVMSGDLATLFAPALLTMKNYLGHSNILVPGWINSALLSDSSLAQSKSDLIQGRLEDYLREHPGDSDATALASYRDAATGTAVPAGNDVPAMKVNIAAFEARKAALSQAFGELAYAKDLGAGLADGLDNDELKQLLMLFARFIIGDGIGSHPSANGHAYIWSNIKNVLENDIRAKEMLRNRVWNAEVEFCQLVAEYGPEVFDKALAYAVENDILDAETAAQLKEICTNLVNAINAGDAEAIAYNSALLAAGLYIFADANGYVPEEISDAVATIAKIYNDTKDMTAEEKKEYFCKMLEEHIEKYGPDAIRYIEQYMIEQGVLTAEEVAMLNAQVKEIINNYKEDPEEATKQLIKDLAHWLYDVNVEKKIIDPAVVDSAIAQALEIRHYLDIMNTPVSDGEIENYVALGASYTTGYGMSGYSGITDEQMAKLALDPAKKDELNVFGYKKVADGSYVDLIGKELGVTPAQLAMSSMRIEEIRVLLEKNYNGDAYTAWRFTDGDKWFEKAGGIDALRAEYANYIANADLITIDAGVNNFGVYLANELTKGLYGHDLKDLDPAVAVLYADAKEFVYGQFEKYAPEVGAEDYDNIVDTLAYALLGYCYNFDRVMNDIYTLNPDVQVVVVSIQNVLDGLSLKVGDTVIPAGEIFGAIINVANTYMAVGSPFAPKYLCADVRKDGRVELFIDDLKPCKEIRNCFDVLDNNINLKREVWDYLSENWKYIYANIVGAQGLDFETSTKLFDAYDGVEDTTTLDSFLAIDFDDESYIWPTGLDDDDAPNMKKIQTAVKTKCTYIVNCAYDAMLAMVKEAAKVDTLNYKPIADSYVSRVTERALLNAIKDELAIAVGKAVESKDNTYAYTLGADFFQNVAERVNNLKTGKHTAIVTEDDVKTVAALAVRISLGNSFFAHPNANGHKEMADTILFALENKITGYDVIDAEVKYAAEKLYEQVVTDGTAKLEEIKAELIASGYATEEELAALDAIIAKAAEALAAGDEEALKAACNELAELAYAYADNRGYIPSELKEAVAKAIELYEEYKDKTVEEIKAEIKEQIETLIKEQTEAALIALRDYIVEQGWLTEEELAQLDEIIASLIAAYKADPEGTTDKIMNDLVDFLFAAAIAEGIVDVITLENAQKLIAIVAAAYDYYLNTPEEQIKIDATLKLFDLIDEYAPEYISEEVAQQIKMDILTLIMIFETYSEDEIKEMANQYVESQKALYELLLFLSTHGEYTPDKHSYYVALGGGTVYGLGIGRADKSYVELLAEYYGVDSVNFAKENLLPDDIVDYVKQYAAGIEKADFITYQLDASSFILAALGEKAPDWSKYLTEDQIAVVNAALEVAKEILADDWNKYVDFTAEDIINDLTGRVNAKLYAVNRHVYEKLAEGEAQIAEAFKACVEYIDKVVAFVQSKLQIAANKVLDEIAFMDEVFEKTQAILEETEFETIDWINLREEDIFEIIEYVKAELLKLNPALEKVTEAVLGSIVAASVKLYRATMAELAKINERMNAKEQIMADKLYKAIKRTVIELFPCLDGLTRRDIHDIVVNKIKSALPAEYYDEYDAFLTDKELNVEEIIDSYIDIARAYVEYAFDNIEGAVAMLEGEHEKFKEAVAPYIAFILEKDWTEYVDKNAEWIAQNLENALRELLAEGDAFVKSYVDAHAEELLNILTPIVNEVKAVVAKAQAQKDMIAEVVEVLEPAKDYIEKFLYAVVAYVVNTNKAIDEIRAINPDAEFVAVGMYNPLEGLHINYQGQDIDVGKYADYFVELTNAFYANLAIVKGNYTFVAVPKTETNGFGVTIDLEEVDLNKIGTILMNLYSNMHANANGNEYIFEQIVGSLYTLEAPEVMNWTELDKYEIYEAITSFEDDNTLFVVEGDRAVLVAAEYADGMYTVLEGTFREEDNCYVYDISDLGDVEEYELHVVLKGDANLDGKIDDADIDAARKLSGGADVEITFLGEIVADVNGDGVINSTDVGQIRAAAAGKLALAW